MSILRQIFADKAVEVEAAQALMPIQELKAIANDLPSPFGFLAALKGRKAPLGLIAEVKKASPSQSTIRSDFDPAAIASAYARAGAQAISVLTDQKYFQGSPENLPIAKRASGLPTLRKDFLYCEYQFWEARAWGADAVLLIAASFSRAELAALYQQAREIGLDVLLEVHNEAEAEDALAIGADLIGVNNRDLGDFKTDLAVSERLIPMLKGSATTVSESALSSPEDLARVHAAGADAVLIGTAFCAAPDIESKVREVMGWEPG